MKPAKIATLLYMRNDFNDTCEWYGTEWVKDPASKGGMKLLPCGQPTIGKGLFLDPVNEHGESMSLCERHASRDVEPVFNSTTWA